MAALGLRRQAGLSLVTVVGLPRCGRELPTVTAALLAEHAL